MEAEQIVPISFLGIIDLEPVLVRSVFLTAAVTVLIVNTIPSFRSRFLAYGSRSSSHSTTRAQKSEPNGPSKVSTRKPPIVYEANTLLKALDYLASWQVPHGFFKHFYILSVSSSLFWAYDLVRHVIICRRSLPGVVSTAPAAAVSQEQVVVVWTMMLFQGVRRLYESFAFDTKSKSQMWFVHWLLGLAFYLFMGIAVWIEGAHTVRLRNLFHLGTLPYERTMVASTLFAAASRSQHLAHRHLYDLRTKPRSDGAMYSLPEHPLFAYTLTPHYFAECLIYLSLCIAGAPAGSSLNLTLLCALAFVAANLGVTASGTWEWYGERFGSAAVRDRARMVPLIW